ncbi:hypothetical protein [Streptomyces sp. NPDC044948]|uniref:hypothetical protein n=1 Tax=Streptomyces sp. NPDC044948 TaxID=3157092 RepID=UPI0034029281
MTAPDRIASQAADLLRSFNHATFDIGDDWQYPGHAYSAVGSLAYLIRMLPQAIEQTARPMERTHHDGRLLIDGGGDSDQAVGHLREAVKTAAQIAALLAQAVEHVHVSTSSMGMDLRGLPELEE